MTCPACKAEIDFEPAYPADPPTNVGEWNGGFLCGCGWKREDEDPEPFEDTGPMPERQQ